MKAPRSVIRQATDTAPREFLSVAVRIVPATSGKDGFYVQVLPDMRGPQSIYLSYPQLERLITVAESSATDAEVWAELAKIPLEPVAPARGLYPRFRALLVDCAGGLRDEIAVQRQRAEVRARPPGASETTDSVPTIDRVDASPAAPLGLGRPLRDPDAL
jgi:hypothetical protein